MSTFSENEKHGHDAQGGGHAGTDRGGECGCEEHKPRHKIDFLVDRELLQVFSDEDIAHLTVREILDISGNQPPEDYELVEFVGHENKQEKHTDLSEKLTVKQHAKFAPLFKGCTPVS